MTFGIKVFTKTGPAYNLDANCTSMFISGALGTDVYPQTGLYVPEGYDYYAHLSDACGFFDFIDDDGSSVVYSSVAPVSYLDDKRQLCFKNGKFAIDSITGTPPEVNIKNNQQLVLLTWPKPNRSKGHGILFNGVNSFFQINQNSNFTNVIWKGDIEINRNGWTVQSINPMLSHYNSFIFFYCDDPSISVGKSWELSNRDVGIVYVPYNHNGGISNRTILTKVVVFGISTIKTSKYGLRIYKNKNIVYDSCNEILINPVFTSFDKYALGQMRSINGIRRPMFARVSIGARHFNTGRGGRFCDIGLRSNGYQLSTTEQIGLKTYWMDSELKFASFISEQKVLILDAENYFKF